MWRRNNFPGNSDSDQSISDEDDFNGDLGDNCVSLPENAKKEVGLQLQSQLEFLRGTQELSPGRRISNLAHEKQVSFFAEDEVETPDFPDEGGFIFSPRKESTHNSNEKVISDDEDNCALSKDSITSSDKKLHRNNSCQTFESGKQDGAYAWSMVSKEAETLICLNENALSSCSAYGKANKSRKGVRGKAKPKFSFHFRSHKDGLSQPLISKGENVISSKVHDLVEQSETIEHGIVENSNPDLHEDFHGENDNQSKIMPADVEVLGQGFIEHSMTELLDGLQDKNILYSRTKEKKAQLARKRTISPLGDRIIEDEDQPENMPSGSPSDDEANYQNLKVADSEMHRQSMADRFQEALAATASSNEGFFVATCKPLGIGLFGKLQQVMQSEKERDTTFLKKLQMLANQNGEPCSIVVRIQSRYLDAKLTVCHCSFGTNIEGSQWPESSQTLVDRGRTKTVIFSPIVCSDVDLDVGNLIRIHPPWKEVQVTGKDEIIILSTYFSQILM